MRSYSDVIVRFILNNLQASYRKKRVSKETEIRLTKTEFEQSSALLAPDKERVGKPINSLKAINELRSGRKLLQILTDCKIDNVNRKHISGETWNLK
ncbi:hypothetical protein P5673_029892 [Acropora cervicornis]|uniref:Uncharacterized protein n=1 Tax=Acropora cervicornis TaxID=6130 RepID=A0AAD9PVD8_ACRCE|nr:hypothetical protein P5673_029892 [Acropora cervicornis]